jgi:predicted MFS family arabinose efflux permease
MTRRTARAVGALIALALSTFAYVTTETLPIGLLLPIAQDLGSTASAVGLLVTGYGLVVVLTSIPLTHLTRRVSRRLLISGLLGVFVVGTLISAIAPNYATLMGSRILTALSQALFWSIVAPTTAGLFSERVRGRALSVMLSGGSLAAVLGVPAGTWLGQQSGWRVSFAALAGLGVITMLATAWLLPGGRAAEGAAAHGKSPDALRYSMLITMAALAVTGSFVAFTYVTPFMVDVTGFSAAAIGPLLLVRGLAGVIGVTVGGWLADYNQIVSMIVPVALQSAALLALYAVGGQPVPTVILVAVSGLTFTALSTAMATRVLHLAPFSVDLAFATLSTAVNVGITAGALIGALLLPAFGVRSTVLVGGLLSVAALAIVLVEPYVRKTAAADPGTERGETDAPLSTSGQIV